ncbi:MAG: DUF805 domain-containing protein [Pseudomonadota bacterium]
MNSTLAAVAQTFDPRGRCDRRGLLYVMLATLALQAAIAVAILALDVPFTGPIAIGLKMIFVWVAASASIQRLHDCNRSGFWLPGSLLFLFIWVGFLAGVLPIMVAVTFGAEHIRLFSPMFYLIVALSYLPILAAALWLHFAKGNAGANRFGAAPSVHGFSGALITRFAVADGGSPEAAEGSLARAATAEA